MLSEDVDRYIALRRTLGYKLRKPARHLRAFAGHAASRGEAHIRTATVLAWVTAAGRTQDASSRALLESGAVRALPSRRRPSA